jgi:hypothetical protein
MSNFCKSIIVMSILGVVMTVSSAHAVVVNFGHDRYIICLNNSESMAVFQNPNAAGFYADIAAKQALRQIGMSPTLTGKAAQTGVFMGLRNQYAAHFRERARMHHGTSFCIHYQCNVQVIRFLLNDLTRVTDEWMGGGMILEILNGLMNTRVIH